MNFKSVSPDSLSPKEGLSQASEASSGVKKDAGTDELNQIAAISDKAQTFMENSIMGRGLTVQKFSSAKPGKNWELNYPYRFLVTRVNGEGKHSLVASYRLPINPQQLKVTTPFAIKTTVTSKGILEEHNGAPIRQISISGTTGINIERKSGGKEVKRTDIIGTLFGGTLDAVNSATRSVKIAGGALGLNSSSPFRTNSEDAALTRTGYYQFQLLDLFLHTYASAKEAPGGQDLRLVFEMAKDNVIYVVSPVSFGKTRTVSSPMEYFYDIQLLAWATLPDFMGAAPAPGVADVNPDVGDYRRALNTIKTLRKTVKSFQNIVSAVRADVESNIFGPLNDVILLLKDTLSIPLAIADLPKSLRNSFMTSVAASWQSLSATNEDLKKLFDKKFQDIIKEGSGATSSSSKSSFASTSSDSITYLGAATQDPSSPNNIFSPEVFDNIDLTDNVNLDQLQLTNSQQYSVSLAVEDARDITTNEINDLIAELSNLSALLEPSIQDKNALDEEWDLLYAIGDSITELYGLISNGNLNNSQKESDQTGALSTTAMSFWESATQSAGIDYQAPLGKFSVPFPFGSNMEQLAFVYLGDATRWSEIVALNGLQYPYIDEDGFQYALIGNGSQNQINVSSDTNLFVGQSIFISSDEELTTKRKIQAISKVNDSNFIITVDGAANLEIYQTQDNAYIKAYLPYTINSMRQVHIPTDTPPANEELDTPPITFLPDDPETIKFTKIDWLLDPYGDLAVTKDGFMNLAFGKTNLLQAAKMKLTTIPGSLLLHPEYGAGVEVGQSFADINLENISKRIDQAFRDDPRFLAPSVIELNAQPGVLYEHVVAIVAKDNGILPIAVPLTRQ